MSEKATKSVTNPATGVTYTFGPIQVGIWEGTAVRGYLLAVERFKEAVAANVPDDLTIAIFEAANWIVSINENDHWITDHSRAVPKYKRFDLSGHGHVRALMYVRHRIHHNWAAAIGPGAEPGESVWRDREILFGPFGRHHSKATDEALYDRLLAGRPVVEVLDLVSELLTKAVPKAVGSGRQEADQPAEPASSPDARWPVGRTRHEPG